MSIVCGAVQEGRWDMKIEPVSQLGDFPSICIFLLCSERFYTSFSDSNSYIITITIIISVNIIQEV